MALHAHHTAWQDFTIHPYFSRALNKKKKGSNYSACLVEAIDSKSSFSWRRQRWFCVFYLRPTIVFAFL